MRSYFFFTAPIVYEVGVSLVASNSEVFETFDGLTRFDHYFTNTGAVLITVDGRSEGLSSFTSLSPSLIRFSYPKVPVVFKAFHQMQFVWRQREKRRSLKTRLSANDMYSTIPVDAIPPLRTLPNKESAQRSHSSDSDSSYHD